MSKIEITCFLNIKFVDILAEFTYSGFFLNNS